jgi:hypothetical protein
MRTFAVQLSAKRMKAVWKRGGNRPFDFLVGEATHTVPSFEIGRAHV